jgi:four helix bundle protein
LYFVTSNQISLFDFENLEVFNKAKKSHLEIKGFLKEQKQIPRFYNDQLSRASLSVVLNIAEGSGRVTNNDRKHFYVIARGSIYETVALINLICDEYQISGQSTKELLISLETISKMIFGLI